MVLFMSRKCILMKNKSVRRIWKCFNICNYYLKLSSRFRWIDLKIFKYMKEGIDVDVFFIIICKEKG